MLLSVNHLTSPLTSMSPSWRSVWSADHYVPGYRHRLVHLPHTHLSHLSLNVPKVPQRPDSLFYRSYFLTFSLSSNGLYLSLFTFGHLRFIGDTILWLALFPWQTDQVNPGESYYPYWWQLLNSLQSVQI
jgi:hypothetical protein